MAVKQTAGREALGEFAPNSQSSMTTYCSARCGAGRTSSPSGTGAW